MGKAKCIVMRPFRGPEYVSLSLEELENLCILSRLEITPEEMEGVAAKLSEIVAMVDALQAVDTSGVEPMAHPLDRAQELREDRVTESDRHVRYQRNAGRVERGLYLVPRVIE